MENTEASPLIIL
uniref:Uncharacterized protein n=1 Tax=Anguilla anguilla TaxID=7936 RepID=A0A0E9USJ2_ANGAN